MVITLKAHFTKNFNKNKNVVFFVFINILLTWFILSRYICFLKHFCSQWYYFSFDSWLRNYIFMTRAPTGGTGGAMPLAWWNCLRAPLIDDVLNLLLYTWSTHSTHTSPWHIRPRDRFSSYNRLRIPNASEPFAWRQPSAPWSGPGLRQGTRARSESVTRAQI